MQNSRNFLLGIICSEQQKFFTRYNPLRIARSSHQRCSVRKGVLRNFTKFTGKQLCQSLFLNKVVGLRPFSQSTSWRLLLNSRNNLLRITYSEQQKYSTLHNLLRIAMLKYLFIKNSYVNWLLKNYKSLTNSGLIPSL